MNAHTLRKWSPIKIFMYLLLVICSLLVFWCQGASAMHLTPLDFPSFNLKHRHRHQKPEKSKPDVLQPTSQNRFISVITNFNSTDELPLHRFHQQKLLIPSFNSHNELKEKLKFQRQWQNQMREKRIRIQVHRKEKHLLQKLLDQQSSNDNYKSSRYKSSLENLEIILNHNMNSNSLKLFINNNNIKTTQKHLKSKNLNHKINTTSHDDHPRRQDLYETLNQIVRNISETKNRNRRDSRYFHHHHHHQQPQKEIPVTSLLLYNANIITNHRNSNSINNRQKRRRYCSARDPRTLAFEAPTVFEGKIKSMTPDRQANFSVTVEILKVYKQQINFTLPRQVRLQFAYKNNSECDIYREEFRHRGFVRDEVEQGKIYYLFVKQISLGNFTILGQPIKKISRTAKDVEIGVSEKYGKRASIESMSPNLTVKEGKRVRIVCKVEGEPAPKVTWFKDGRSINRNRTKYVFVHLRRRSDLIIKSAISSDNGKYECRAKNKLTLKRPVSNFTWLDVLSKHNPTAERTIKPLNEGMKECPAGGQLFCLNGGKCWFIESLQEPSCDCPEGFSGKNCEDKTPNITASYEFADPYVLNPSMASNTEYDDHDA